MTLTAGTLLKDNLRLVRELGHGAMGTVWIAENLTLGSEVAVKVLHHSTTGEQARARFAQEARGVASIDSPHVVKIFDYGVTDDGEPFIVMELLRGEDLRDYIERNGPLSATETVRLIRQVCRGLGRAHDRGIVHRDIKPANIFLMDNDGETMVKVLDFGVAKQLGDGDLGMTETGTMMGTPYYMSPEQLLDPRNVDARTDVWAVGAVAYACLTASLPFVGETLGALSVAIHTGDFEAPTKRAPGLPGELDAWMARALARKPEDRFASVRQMANALQQAIGSQASPPSSAQSAEAAPAQPQAASTSSDADLPVASTVAMTAAQGPADSGEAAAVPASGAADTSATGSSAAGSGAGAAGSGAGASSAAGSDAAGSGASAAGSDAAGSGARAAGSAAAAAGTGESPAGAVSATGEAAATGGTAATAAATAVTAKADAAVGSMAQSAAAVEPSTLSSAAQPQAQSSGMGRMLLVALGAGLLVAGGIFVGTRLSSPTGTPDNGNATNNSGNGAPSNSTATSGDSTAASDGSTPSPDGSAAPADSSNANSNSSAALADNTPGPNGSGTPAGHSSSTAAGAGAALSAHGVLTASHVRSAMLSCWARNEGKNPGVKGSAALVILERPHGPAINSLAMRHPHFKKCAYGALSTLYQRQFEGRFEVKVQLPGASMGPTFPSAAEINSAARSCWASTEGSQAGTPAFALSGQVWYGGFSMGTRIPHKQFKSCFLNAVRGMNKRGDDNTARVKFSVQLSAGAGATPMP